MRRRRVAPAILAGLFLASGAASWAVLGAPAGATAPAANTSVLRAPKTGYVIYWDQDEEEDYYASATNTQGQLITPWDPNGQMCLLNDGTGRFVVGYDPTQPSQHNPGGPPHRPYKQPPIGEELVARGHEVGVHGYDHSNTTPFAAADDRRRHRARRVRLSRHAHR